MNDRSCDQFCSPSGHEYSGWQGECHNCGEWRWSNGSDKLYKVWELGGDLPIVEVSSFDGSLVQDLETPRTVRMMWSSSYSRNSSHKKKSHIEHLLVWKNLQMQNYGRTVKSIESSCF